MNRSRTGPASHRTYRTGFSDGFSDAFSAMMALPSAFLAAVLSGAWDPIADMPTRRESGAMTLVGDGKLIPKRVAYLGGSAQGLHHHKGWANAGAGVGDVPFASAVLYDPSTQAWTRLPDMSMPRDSPAACAIGDVLYVFGGTAKFPVGTTNSMEYIQLGSLNPKWIVGPPLPGSNPHISHRCVTSGRGWLRDRWRFFQHATD